jgi:hypothetical protein
MLYDLCCTVLALRAAASWVYSHDGTSVVTLARDGSQLTVRQGDDSAAYPSGEPAGPQQVHLTREALAAAAAWAVPGDGMVGVTLLVDDRMLLVAQGDDRTAFDTGGEPASAEYLDAAPLDRVGDPGHLRAHDSP